MPRNPKRGYVIPRGYSTKRGETRFTLGVLANLIKQNGETLIDEEGTPLHVFESIEWLRVDQKFFVRCNRGHVRHVRADNSIKATCSQCQKSPYSIDDLRRHAESNGGVCESTEYKTGYSKYDWVCKSGHTWSAAWKDVNIKKTWCPVCAAKLKGENLRGAKYPFKKRGRKS